MPKIDELLKTDIEHKSDLSDQNGDLKEISGRENMKLAILHRIVTEPGSLIGRPNYGVGIKRFQNALNTVDNRRDLAKRIEENLLRDDRVESVQSVSVQMDPRASDQIVIAVRVKILGFDEVGVSFRPFGGGIQT